MKRYHGVGIISLLLITILFLGTVLLCSGKAMAFYKQSITQRAIVRGVDNMTHAQSDVLDGLSELAQDVALEQYDILYNEIVDRESAEDSEAELLALYHEAYVDAIELKLGNDDTICDIIEVMFGDEINEKTHIDRSCIPKFSVDRDTQGKILGARLKNVVFRYDGAQGAVHPETIQYEFKFPESVFHVGNEQLFKFSIVSGKGIYLTGPTSTIVGDVYAGQHSADESRDAEAMYGEIGTYGGLNILSTQVCIKADNIVSEGDINMNGSFVILSPDNEQLKVYAKDIHEISSFTQRTIYSLDGTLYKIKEKPAEAIEHYSQLTGLIDNSMSFLDKIGTHYDSDNDDEYTGTYRKIISTEDIEIKSDFTGVVLTPGNVIIDVDCNFEGLIICGDRVYTQGNNNIVANPEVLRELIREELMTEGDIGIFARDYIGGINIPGVHEPDYYVVPYRE